MSKSQSPTRSIVREIEIDAPVEAVWKALIDAEEVTRWLADQAKIVPGVGGSYWVSWGEGQAGESRIEAWEPGKYLRIRNLPWDAEGQPSESKEETTTATPLIQEFTIETRGGKTILRLVDSGMPSDPSWDGMYDGKTRGWEMFFLALRHYLEKHPGQHRRHVADMRPINTGLTEAWAKITGPEGLAANGSFAGLEPGSRYSVTTVTGDSLEGEVLINKPPKTLTITIDSLNGAMLTVTFEEMGGTTYLYFSLGTYGMNEESDAELRNRWTGLLRELFPVE